MRCSLPRRGTQHAIHPNGSNHRRVPRLDVVARVRRLCETGLLKERPPWLEWCERVPPLENHSLNFQARTIRNPYPQMVNYLLKKYPDLRFQDCYVDGNDWSAGNDTYRDDHPVMQFVARQLEFMRDEGMSKKEAFRRTEELFRDRREELEREQKVMMAYSMDDGLLPMFATGRAYLEAEKCKAEAAQLNIIRKELRKMRVSAVQRKEAEKAAQGKEAEDAAKQGRPEESLEASTSQRLGRGAQERKNLWDAEKQRKELVGKVSPPKRQVLSEDDGREAASAESDHLAKARPDEAPDEDEQRLEARGEGAGIGIEPQEGRASTLADPVQPAPARASHEQLQRDADLPEVHITQRVEKTKKTVDKLGAMLGGSGVAGEDAEDDDMRIGRKERDRGRGFGAGGNAFKDDMDISFDDGLGEKKKKKKPK